MKIYNSQSWLLLYRAVLWTGLLYSWKMPACVLEQTFPDNTERQFLLVIIPWRCGEGKLCMAKAPARWCLLKELWCGWEAAIYSHNSRNNERSQWSGCHSSSGKLTKCTFSSGFIQRKEFFFRAIKTNEEDMKLLYWNEAIGSSLGEERAEGNCRC